VIQYQKGKTNLDFTEARDSGWQWHQLGYIQVCTSLQRDNHTSTQPLLFFLQVGWNGCPSCHSTNSVKALKALAYKTYLNNLQSSVLGTWQHLDKNVCFFNTKSTNQSIFVSYGTTKCRPTT